MADDMIAFNPGYTPAGCSAADTFSRRLAVCRKRSQLTYKALAEKVGAKPERLSKLERGISQGRKDPELLAALAKVFGVSQVWLYAGAAAGSKLTPEWDK